MVDVKKCMVCGNTQATKWIERTNLAGVKAHFCGKACFEDYKKQGAERGVCEFC